MVRFGTTADEHAESYSGDDIWIKGFKEGSTRVRFLQPTGSWVTYREHYSEGPGFFPCSEDTSTCPGCTDSSEKVQKRNRRYAMNCLGESGRIDVHKVGSRLYKTLKAREQRLETIMDRDYTIVRSGKGLDTVYDVDPGDKYALDDADTLELHDIGKILGEKYNEALEAYGLEPEFDEGDDPVAEKVVEKAATAKPKPDEQPDKEPEPAPPADEPGDQLKHLHSGFIKVKDADTDLLREFLKEKDIEFPARAPRARLETIVSNWIDANPPF
jgi:hypothetical protein